MRVNIEDDLWTSGRLSKLARSLRWDEGKALGALVNVYRLTQMARLSEETASRVATVIVIAFDSDEEADAFITAMIAAQLACVTEDGNVRIRGNKRRIEELDEWYDKSVRGGKTRAASGTRNGSGRYEKPNDQSRQAPGNVQASTSQAPGVLSPMSLVLSLNTEETTNTEDPKGVPKPKRKRKASPVPSVPGVTVPVRDAWVAAYEKRYPGQRAAWGAKEGGQCKTLLGTYTAFELVELVRHFFAWKRPEVIRAGHSFGTGGNSFMLKIHELRADMAAPQRRAEAAKLHERERISDTEAADADQITRIATGETVDAYATGTANKRRLDEAFQPPTRTLGEEHQAPGIGTQPQDVRGRGHDVLQALEPVRAHDGALLRALDAGGRGAHAIDRHDQVRDGRQGGPATVPEDTRLDARGAGAK